MRYNLLSNKKTTDLLAITQKRLATGKKVTSAIDNPNSFFTAANLENRSQDLSALLETMEQGAKTIETAATTLKSGEKLLQLLKASAIAGQENTTKKTTIDLNWLEDSNINMNKVATTKASLISKLNSAVAGETIYVFGDIDMGDEALTVKDGVKLAGIQTYLEEHGYDEDFDASNTGSLSFDMGSQFKSGVTMGNNSSLENLTLSMNTEYTGEDVAVVYINNKTGVKLRNLDVTLTSHRTNNQSAYIGAISSKINSVVEMSGTINIKASGGSVQGIFHNGYNNIPTLNITQGAIINIETTGNSSSALRFGNIYSQGTINIKTSGSLSHGIEHLNNNSLSGEIDIQVTGTYARGFRGNLNFLSTAKVFIESDWYTFEGTNSNISAGAIIGIKNSGQTSYEVYQSTTSNLLTGNINSLSGNSNFTSSTYSYDKFLEELKEGEKTHNIGTFEVVNPEASLAYNQLLEQYNMLISDSSYNGVNLLLNQNLQLFFNENRSSSLTIEGKDATAQGLGLEEVNWYGVEDVTITINQVDEAINKLRIFSENFSNTYSTISNRLSFTENLINILEEGSDKLTLADMNEESANMLALQVRQQLGINSLSLASEAANSILKLFS